jgi:DNA-binding MarR family transcriptional regulator
MVSMTAETPRQATADQLLAAMAAVRRTTRRRTRRPTELSSLTGAQLELVRLVRRCPGISVAESAAELSLAPNTVSTLVKQLTDARILCRLVDQTDRRMARLDLSPGIRRKVDAWRDRKVELVAAALSRLSESEQQSLEGAVEALGRLAEEVEAQEHAARLDQDCGRRGNGHLPLGASR